MSDSQPPPRRRSLIFEPSFEAAREGLEPDYRRFDHVTAGAQWLIEENADSCPIVEGEWQMRVAFATQPGEDILRIFFTINADDTQCSLWLVDRVQDPMDPLTGDS